MADKNVTIKRRNNSSNWDSLYPKTKWSNVLNKPSTFTPEAHDHPVTKTITVGQSLNVANTYTFTIPSTDITKMLYTLTTGVNTFIIQVAFDNDINIIFTLSGIEDTNTVTLSTTTPITYNNTQYFANLFISLASNSDNATVSFNAIQASNNSGESLPQRISLAQNLVVNINGNQYRPGVASWSGNNSSSVRQFQINGSVAGSTDITGIMEHLTGSSAYDVYSSTKPTPCFVLCTSSNTVWKLQYDGTTNGLRAYKVNNFPFALKNDVNPIIDVAELPNSNINEGKFYRTTKIGEHIKRGVPNDTTTPFANLVFDTTLSVSEVMDIVYQDGIAYENDTLSLGGNSVTYYLYWINYNQTTMTPNDTMYGIIKIPQLNLGNGAVDFALICNYDFMIMVNGGTPDGTPNVLWCSNGDILSALTSGQVNLTGWNPLTGNHIDTIYCINGPATAIATSNNLLIDLVWCTEFDVYKEITTVYEDGDSGSSKVGLCDTFFKPVYPTDLILFDSNNIPDASSVYTGIMNGTYPYQINDDGNGGKVITAMFALTTSTTTYEPYTDSTLYMYIAILDTSGTPSVQNQIFADAKNIFSYVLSQQLGDFTIDTSLKKEITLYHYKDTWHEVGAGGGLESDVLYAHINTLENIIALQRNKIITTHGNGVVIFTVQDGD